MEKIKWLKLIAWLLPSPNSLMVTLVSVLKEWVWKTSRKNGEFYWGSIDLKMV